MTDARSYAARSKALAEAIGRTLERYDHQVSVLVLHSVADIALRAQAAEQLRAEQAEATLTRVRQLVAEAAHTTAAGISDYDVGRHELAAAVLAALDEPAPDIATRLRTLIESEIYEYRERTMFWEEGGVTGEIARLATRGALEALGLPAPEPAATEATEEQL